MSADADLVALFREELALCKVGPGETLAVLTQGNRNGAYAEAFMDAARALGAQSFQINLPGSADPANVAVVGHTALAGNPAAVAALKNADIVIDLVFLLFSPEQIDIQNSGTRILSVLEDVEVMRRRFPTQALRARVECGERLLKDAKELRVTSRAGTDVTYRLGRYPTITEYGFTDQPGRWDIWPSGFLFTGAHDDGVDGKVVLDVGDVMFAFRRYVEAPVTLTIERGYVTRIDGEGKDAHELRSYMASFGDPRAYAVSHIGWGLDDKADSRAFDLPDTGIGTDVLAFCGNVLFSTGPNGELGGTNDTACHLDLPLHNCTLTLDGVEIVRDGRIVHPGMMTAN